MIARISAASRWLSRHRFGATLVAAFACHLGLMFLPSSEARHRPSRSRADVEVELIDWERALTSASREATGEVARDESRVPVASRQAVVGSTLPSADAPAPDAESLGAEARPEPASGVEPAQASPAPVAGERKGVRLLLGSKDLAEMVRRSAPAEAPTREAPAPPSVGLLTEGLEALDAEKGLSRSSAAISACYRAAEMGPDVGTAVLEVRTDARGAVMTVSVVGNDGSTWSLVADTLLDRLKHTLLRVPNGARGLVTRLRIDRGYLAEDPSARGRTKPGAAIGQDHHAKDYGWDESTQAGTSRGRLSPSLGVSSDSLRRRVKTRVLLLSQQPL